MANEDLQYHFVCPLQRDTGSTHIVDATVVVTAAPTIAVSKIRENSGWIEDCIPRQK